MKDKDSFTPIQWKGHQEKFERYQGEKLNKAKLQKKFRSFLSKLNVHSYKENRKEIPDFDFLLKFIMTLS